MNRRKTLAVLILSMMLAFLLSFPQTVLATTITWTAKNPMATKRTWPAAATHGGMIYVFGGRYETTELASVERYDPSANAWTYRADMPAPRYGAAAVAANNLIYVFGGVDDANHILDSVDVYDPATNLWSSAAPMLTKRCRLAAALGPNGKIYVMGGSTTSAIDIPDTALLLRSMILPLTRGAQQHP